MGKTLILSQKQLDEIIGESDEAFTYLYNSNSKEYPDNEINLGVKSDGSVDNVTTDTIANTKKREEGPWSTDISRGIYGSYTTTSTRFEGKIKNKEKILENNKDLYNIPLVLTPTVYKKLQKIYDRSKAPKDDKGRMTLKEILDNGKMSYTEATTLQSRLIKCKNTDEYEELGGEVMEKFINDNLKREEEIDKRKKDTNTKLGMENQYRTPKVNNGKIIPKK